MTVSRDGAFFLLRNRAGGSETEARQVPKGCIWNLGDWIGK